jgi:hypothetical protein
VWAFTGSGVRPEFTGLHYAVLRQDLPTVRVLLQEADCGKGSAAILEVVTPG